LPDFEELRNFVVNGSTTTVKLMLNLVENTTINQIQNLSLLTKLGECIASTILSSEDSDNFKHVLSYVMSSSHANSKQAKVAVKIYLQIILSLLRDKNFANLKKLR
jgi:hypothetical protein